jgi:hypothetical protein
LSEKRAEKSFSDRVIEKSVELFGYTPDEKSNINIEWMHEHGYFAKHKRVRHQRGGV